MSSGARIAVLAAVIVVAIGGFVLASSGGDDKSTTTTTTATTTDTSATGTDTTTTAAPAGPPAYTIDVVGGKPEGGIQKIKVNKGDQVQLVVNSDVADEIHIHGYDFMKDVEAGGTVRFNVQGDDRRQLRDRARERTRSRSPSSRSSLVRALRTRPRAGRAHRPAHPEMAVRLGRGGRARHLVRRARGAVAQARAAGGARAAAVPDAAASSSRCSALIGVAAFIAVVYAGLRGAQDAQDNLAPTIIYVHFWVGMAVVSILFGDVFRALNPWRAIARFVAWVGRALLARGRRPRRSATRSGSAAGRRRSRS